MSAISEPQSHQSRKRGGSNVKGALFGIVSLVAVLKIGIPLVRAVGSRLRGQKKEEEKVTEAKSAARQVVSFKMTLGEDSWKVSEDEPPEIPKAFRKLCESEISCSVSTFYERFLASKSSFWPESHITIGRQTITNLSPWEPTIPLLAEEDKTWGQVLLPLDQAKATRTGFPQFDAQLGAHPDGFMRLMLFSKPPSAMMKEDAVCLQRQSFTIFKGGVLMMQTCQNMTNIPFKDCFCVKTWWTIRPSADGASCNATVHMHVHFVKACLVRPIIESTTYSESVNFFTSFLERMKQSLLGPLPDADGTADVVLKPSSTPESTGMLSRLNSNIEMLKLTPEHRVLVTIGAMFLYVCILLHQFYLSSQIAYIHRACFHSVGN